MLDFEIIKNILEELDKGFENFDEYVKFIDYEQFKEIFNFLISNYIIVGNIKFATAMTMRIYEEPYLTSKGKQILNLMREGHINSLEDL